MSTDHKWFLQRVEECLCDAYGFLGVIEAGQDKGKLITTWAREAVAFADTLFESTGDSVKE